MVTKGLASLAIAATLVASGGVVAFAKSHDLGIGFPGKGLEMRVKHHAEIEHHKSTGSLPEVTLCTFTALDKKDMAEVSAHEAFHTGMKTALSARKVSVTAALALTDATAKKTALKKAQEDFKIATKALNETMRKAHRATQSTFKTERKACGEDVKTSTQS